MSYERGYSADREINPNWVRGDMCLRCGNPWNQFNHTDANCEKYKRWSKEEDVKNDTL